MTHTHTHTHTHPAPHQPRTANTTKMPTSLDPLTTPPDPQSHTPLHAHQSTTPPSFFSGPPVLHLLCRNSSLLVSKAQWRVHSVLHGLGGGEGGDGEEAVGINDVAAGVALVNGHGNGHGDGSRNDASEIVLTGVDVWVTSEYVHARLGPYIGLHPPRPPPSSPSPPWPETFHPLRPDGLINR